MTRASVLLGAGSLVMATGLMGAAAAAIELAVEGGVYVTSGALSVGELRSRLASAAVAGVTPPNLYACSYVALAVNEATLANRAGTPVRKGQADLPHRLGVPDGLEHIRNTGDSLMLASGRA